MQLEGDALCTLSRVAGGDMRRAITTLQSAVRLGGSPVRPQTLLDVAGVVPDAAARGLLQACRAGDFAGVQAAVADLIHEGYPVRRSGWDGEDDSGSMEDRAECDGCGRWGLLGPKLTP